MPELIGNTLPPPLRFALGNIAQTTVANAALLISVDDDGCPRVAALAAAEVEVPQPSSLRVRINAGTRTWHNVRSGRPCLLWCVLDAAGYSVCTRIASGQDGGSARKAEAATDEAATAVIELAIESVWRDFNPEAPLLSGPTYRRV